MKLKPDLTPVVEKYGEEWRDAQLVRTAPSMEYDDEGYYDDFLRLLVQKGVDLPAAAESAVRALVTEYPEEAEAAFENALFDPDENPAPIDLRFLSELPPDLTAQHGFLLVWIQNDEILDEKLDDTLFEVERRPEAGGGQ